MTLFDAGQAGKALFFQMQQGLRRRTREFLLSFYSIKTVWIATDTECAL
jgi:predicted amidohydrolase